MHWRYDETSGQRGTDIGTIRACARWETYSNNDRRYSIFLALSAITVSESRTPIQDFPETDSDKL